MKLTALLCMRPLNENELGLGMFIVGMVFVLILIGAILFSYKII